MGGSNLAERTSQQNQQRSQTNAEHDHLNRIHHELQKGHKLPDAMDDILRNDYHELLLKFERLKATSTDQGQEIAFYRDIISDTSPKEMIRCVQQVQHQLRQLYVDFDLFTRENSRVLHDNKKRSEHRFSLRSNLDRVTRTLVLVTEENQALRESLRFKEERLAERKEDEIQLKAEGKEKVLTENSTLHRKKARIDLRSQEVEGHIQRPQTNSLHKQRMQSQQPSDNELLAEISDLRADFAALQSKLKSAETHIVNIGGNLGALVPREVVKDEFNALVGATKIWIVTCVLPAINSAEKCFQAAERARNILLRDAAMGISRVRNQDFRTVSESPGADEGIILVMIFDLLVNFIFSAKVLYGSHDLQREIDVINRLESSMRVKPESSKSLYNARRWMSEASAAILDREETRVLRADFSNALSASIVREIGLAALLGPNNQNALDAATISIRQEVVLPAIELRDKMTCAIDKYSLDVPPYWSEPCVFQTEFFRDLGKLDCRNFGDGGPRLRLEKMQMHLSDDEIKTQLRAICPAIPALVLMEVDDNTLGPPTILVKQQVWVSWQPKEKSRPQPKNQGYFWLLYNQEANACK